MPTAFDADARRRIARATRRVEQWPPDGPRPPPPPGMADRLQGVNVQKLRVTAPSPEGILAGVEFWPARPLRRNHETGRWEDFFAADTVLVFDDAGGGFADGDLVWGRQVGPVRLDVSYGSSPGGSYAPTREWPAFALVAGGGENTGGFWAVLLAGPDDADVDTAQFAPRQGVLPVLACDPDNDLPPASPGHDQVCQRGYAWARIACKPCAGTPAMPLKTAPTDAHPAGQYIGGTQCWQMLYEIKDNRRVPLTDTTTGRQTVVWVTTGPLPPFGEGGPHQCDDPAGFVFDWQDVPDVKYVRVTGAGATAGGAYVYYPGLVEGFSVPGDGFFDKGSLDDPGGDTGTIGVQLFQKANAPLKTDGTGVYLGLRMMPDYDFGDGPEPVFCTSERECG